MYEFIFRCGNVIQTFPAVVSSVSSWLVRYSLGPSQKVHIKYVFQAEISSSEVSRSHTFTMAGQNFERAIGGLNIVLSV